jgi:predicted DNA-binding protein with PD1-like motif
VPGLVVALGAAQMFTREKFQRCDFVLGTSIRTALGGHFLRGRAWPTLDMIISDLPAPLDRKHDEEIGLALIDLSA